jgi:6-phosphogluconate dehydrogenase
MVGLGRMGSGMTRRLLRGGHEVVVHDLSRDAMAAAAAEGAEPANSHADLVAALTPPRVVWLMIPAAVTAPAITALGGLLAAGDVLVDGGNSRYTDTIARAEALAPAGVGLVDAGTSGGIWGLKEGYCLMVGGSPEDVARVEPALRTLAPPDGYAHVGPTGAGHYTKMVHNGVEYALMQAYAEGFDLLVGGPFDLDPSQIAEVWRHGSVVRSWLLDLAARALHADPKLERLSGYVEDSGEGRWTVETGIAHAIPTPTIAAALYARFSSRTTDPFGNRMLAALRNQFGGHAVHAPASAQSRGDREDL